MRWLLLLTLCGCGELRWEPVGQGNWAQHIQPVDGGTPDTTQASR